MGKDVRISGGAETIREYLDAGHIEQLSAGHPHQLSCDSL